MKYLYFILFIALMSQGCGSIQKMRYSAGFNIQPEWWGRNKECQKYMHGSVVKHKQRALHKPDNPIKDSQFYLTENIPMTGFKTEGRVSVQNTEKIKNNIQSSVKRLPEPVAKKQTNKRQFSYINKYSLLGLGFGALTAGSLYMAYILISINFLFLTIFLSIFALAFSGLAIERINNGEGSGKLFARIGLLLGGISAAVAGVVLWLNELWF